MFIKLTKTLLSWIFALLFSTSIINCTNEAVNETTSEHLALENPEKKLSENLKMYKTVWDDSLNNREIDKIEETNFETNITMVSGTENSYNNFFIWEY